MAKKKAIGRGLGAILGEVESAYENSMSDEADVVQEVFIDDIEPNPLQPRKEFTQESLQELSESIKTYGVLQPIVVYEDDDKYILIAGERRLRASKLAGFEYIKAIVADIDRSKLKELALIENIQREDLNPLDLAESFKELIDNYKITHEELAALIHKSRTHITNTLRILNLSEEIKQALRDRKLSHGHAKILAGLTPKEQEVVANSVIGQKLSVRDMEALVKRLRDSDETKNIQKEKKESIKSLNFEQLLKHLGKSRYGNITVSIASNSLKIGFGEQKDVDFFLKCLQEGSKV
ncbi:MAG: ParB/RepB/Spo0J family partition protein [Campylobacterales bacterium]